MFQSIDEAIKYIIENNMFSDIKKSKEDINAKTSFKTKTRLEKYSFDGKYELMPSKEFFNLVKKKKDL